MFQAPPSTPGQTTAMVLQRVIDPVGPHRLCGRVVVGFQRGSKQLGWPTANLDPAAFETKFDADTEGVYVGWASIADPLLPAESRVVHKAVLSMGWNPTFTDVKQRTIVRCCPGQAPNLRPCAVPQQRDSPPRPAAMLARPLHPPALQ